MPIPVAKRVLAIVVLSAMAAVIVFFIFGGWSSKWPPSPEDLLAHEGFSWRTHETADFWIHYEVNSFAEKELGLLTEVHEAAMPGLLELIGAPAYRPKIHIFAVESRALMKSLIGVETNGQALPTQNAILCVFGERTKAGGAHELMHVISNNLWGVVPFKDRIWLDEGLACYAEDKCYTNDNEWKRDMHVLSRRLRDSGRLVPLERLTAGFEHWVALPTEVSYPEAGSFVKFLYERYGREKLKALWQAPGMELQQVYGKSLGELETEWLATLDQQSDR